MKKGYGMVNREEGPLVGAAPRPRNEKKNGKRHAAIGASVVLLAVGAVCGYAALPSSTPSVVKVSNMEVSAPSAFVIPEDDDAVDLAPTYVPPISEFDLDENGMVSVEEYLIHLIKLHDAALDRVEDSDLSSVAKDYISDRLRKNYATEAWCVARLATKDATSPDSVAMDRFELFYSMIKEFCIVQDPSIPEEFNPMDIRLTAAPQTTESPGITWTETPSTAPHVPKLLPSDLSEGQSVKCDLSEPEVYRFTNGTLRHYPNPAIAASWDPYWDAFVVADCASLSRGDDMQMNSLPSTWSPPSKISPSDLYDGQAIKCDLSEPEVYRFTDGQRRHYPDPTIAASWDPNWVAFVVADCSSLPRGDDMPMNGTPSPWTRPPKIPPALLPEGQAIKCDLSEPEVYRFTNGQRRHYPNPIIAASWDPFWDAFMVTDCSSLARGEDMPMNGVPSPWSPTKVSPKELIEGQPVKCDLSEPEVYRFTNGTLRHYPNPAIAASWDPYWDVFIVADCSSLSRGEDMPMNEPPPPATPLPKISPTDLYDGQPIKCDLSEPEVYRFTDGQRRHYPNPTIAASWDPYWDMFVVADCALLPRGPDMPMKPPSLVDGQAVKCDANSPQIFRYWNQTVRLYPDPAVAESWDLSWFNPQLVDCSSLSTGPDMSLKLPPPTNLPEGQAIKCDPRQPEVYRYSSGQLRLYPSPAIASSWDPYWDVFMMVDCSGLPKGGDMELNLPVLSEGQAVKCDDGSAIFRYTGGMIRHYPDPTVADSWDPVWASAIRVNCSYYPIGPDMGFKPAPPTDLREGQSIRCGENQAAVYRFASGEARLYPNPTVASSWDPNWNGAVLVDCVSLRFGDDMKYNQPELHDGQAVKCDMSSPEVFQFANETIRLYPEPRVAYSWDLDWTNATIADCSRLQSGPPMTFSIAKLPEGQAIKCDANQDEVYRFSSDQRRWYPNPAIASSWDPNWGMFLVVDCSLLPRGDDMRFNQPRISEGQAVKCDDSPAIYRFTDASVRWYPSPPIAESWDPNWASPIKIDCSEFARGPDMEQKLPCPTTLPEGQAIKCGYGQTEVYRLSSGQRRWYPSPEIASSWDSNWGNSVAVDCSFLSRGPDMSFNNPPLTDGQAVKCDAGPAVFRYTNGTIRYYPSPAVATSWDPRWTNAVLVDCSHFPQAPEMTLKLSPPSGLKDGQAVKCGPDLPQVYRYTCGQLRWYPNPDIAYSWDKNWKNYLVIDCSWTPIADDMRFFSADTPELPEGLTMKCPDDPDTYRHCSGQRRRYPNERCASSWDPEWTTGTTIASCASLPRGNDMLIKRPIVPEGQAVKCDDGPAIYRFTGGGIRLYPIPPIAQSWDPNWFNPVLIDCAFILRGPDMPPKPAPRPNLPEGQAIKCDPQRPEVYRYASGLLRWYPNPLVASSWDQNWSGNITMLNCSMFSRGPDMEFNQPLVFDGQAVKCDDSPAIYRFTNDSVRWYPDPPIAASWDSQWANPIMMNCSSFRRGPDMAFRLPPPTGLPEGQSIKCDPNSPEVFRLTGGEVRLYPDPYVAQSWNPEWSNFVAVDCSGLPRGKDLQFRQPCLADGQAVKCDNGPNIFRYTNGSIRWYPDPPIAASWDPVWDRPVFVDCSRLSQGPDMRFRLPSPAGLPEGQAIKCDPGQPEVYRLTGGQRRWYPSPPVASSWDPLWFNFVVVDCSSLPPGSDMDYNQPILPEGQAVKCDFGPNIFRYTNGTICWYPNPDIAASWDPVWASPAFVDCSHIPQGPEMQMKLPSPAGLPEGQAITCGPEETAIYRIASGQRRLYPNPVIATSWDWGWYNYIVVDCSVLPRGTDMEFLQPPIPEGQSVRCDSGPSIYRYTNGTIRLYPNPAVAASWDSNWYNPIFVDCSALSRGLGLTGRITTAGWKQLDGSLVQLSFDGKQVCGVNTNDDIWCASENIRGEGATNWRRLPGKLMQIVVYGDALYGVNREGKLFFGSALTSDPSWLELPGWFKQVTTDNKQICGVNDLGGLLCADTGIRVDPNWRKLPGQYSQVELVNGRLFAVTPESTLLSGRASGDPAWTKISGVVRRLSFDGARLCGTSSADDVWCASSGLLDSPNWAMVTTSKMRSVVVQGDDMFAIDAKGNIMYRRSE